MRVHWTLAGMLPVSTSIASNEISIAKACPYESVVIAKIRKIIHV